MFDVGILIGVVFLLGPFGVNGIAMGAVLGAAMHLLIQVPGLIRYRAHWSPELGLRDPNLHRVLRLMLPRIGGLGVFSFNFIIMNNIASRLGENAVAALDWGWRLMQIPETLIGTAMGTVIFPALAALSEQNDEQGKRGAMSGALRFILIATIPSAIGMILIGRPLISLLERGAFDAAASDLVYSTLQFFTLGLITHSLLEIVARSFYADKDTLTPLWAALGGAAINLTLSIGLTGVNPFDPASSGNQISVGMLALANSLGVGFEVIVLLFVLRRRWHSIEEGTLARTVAKTLAASLVMGLVVVVVNTVWASAGLSERGIVWTILHLAVGVGLGGLAFAATAWVLKMQELQFIFNAILRRRKLTGATV
jgi:putative peptidoglycan lipid II flippase